MSRRRRITRARPRPCSRGPNRDDRPVLQDDATAFNNQKKGVITGKGVINNRISEFLMTKLGEIGVPTHFIRRLNMREQLIRQVEIIPLEVVVRNVAAGPSPSASASRKARSSPARSWSSSTRTTSWATRWSRKSTLPLRLGHAAGPRRHGGADPARERLPVRPVPRLRHQADRLQDRVRPALRGRHGPDRAGRRDQPRFVPAGDLRTNEKMDKDRFRRDLGKVEEAYQEVARRLGILIDQDRATCAAPPRCSKEAT